MSDTITIPCAHCGSAVTLERPNTGMVLMDKLLMGLTEGVVHDQCFRDVSAARQLKEAAERLQQRAEKWELLCPAFFQSSEKWLEKPESARKVNKAAIEKALEWQCGQKGILLHGRRTGTGKTTAAWLILKRQHLEGRMIVAMTHAEFTRTATLLMKESDKQSILWMKMLSKCDILFIDDLGKSKFQTFDGTGKAAEEFLFDLVNDRMAAMKPCVFTCNKDGETLKASMSEDRGEPFLRRLRESCVSVNFDKTSFEPKKPIQEQL